MQHELKQKAIKLRVEKQLSYKAILEQVSVSKSTLSQWLRNYPLSREKILELRRTNWKNNEAKIEMFRETMRTKREQKAEELYAKYIQSFKNLSEESFLAAGLMLYQAEGTKTAIAKLVLANTDVRVHKFFIRWAMKFFNVPSEKFKIHLQLYENMDIEKEVKFWQNELGLKSNQIYKPFIRKLSPSSFSYSESFRHGTCQTIVSGSQTRQEVMAAIKAYLDTYTKGV